MSTKLYDGLKLIDSTKDIFDVISILDPKLKKAFKKLAVDLTSEYVARYTPTEEEYEKDKNVFFSAEESWKEEQNKLGMSNTFNDPLRFSIVFGKTSTGKILAYPFSSEPIYSDILTQSGLFEEYGYWNNTDEPEDMSYDEFKARGEEWDEILDENGTLGSLPTYILPDTKSPFMTCLIAQYDKAGYDYPSLDSFRGPEDRYINEFIKKAYAALEEKEFSFSTYSKLVRLVKTYVKENNLDKEFPKPFGVTALEARASNFEKISVRKEILQDFLTFFKGDETRF